MVLRTAETVVRNGLIASQRLTPSTILTKDLHPYPILVTPRHKNLSPFVRGPAKSRDAEALWGHTKSRDRKIATYGTTE